MKYTTMKKSYIKPMSHMIKLRVSSSFLEDSRHGITGDYSESRNINDRRFDWGVDDDDDE
jgi:hypothetical protein